MATEYVAVIPAGGDGSDIRSLAELKPVVMRSVMPSIEVADVTTASANGYAVAPRPTDVCDDVEILAAEAPAEGATATVVARAPIRHIENTTAHERTKRTLFMPALSDRTSFS